MGEKTDLDDGRVVFAEDQAGLIDAEAGLAEDQTGLDDGETSLTEDQAGLTEDEASLAEDETVKCTPCQGQIFATMDGESATFGRTISLPV